MSARYKLAISAMVGCCFIGHPAAAETLLRPNPQTVIRPVANPSRVQPAAADNELGVAILTARLNSDGTSSNASGIKSSSNFGGGGYQVFFDRDVTNCNTVVTPLGFTLVTIRNIVTGPDQLQFNVNKVSDGSLVATPFNLVVFCPK